MKMRTLMILAIAATVALLPMGCTTAGIVPKTEFGWNPVTGDFSMKAPKDVTLRGFQLTRMTNGVQVTIQEYSAKMSPDVIQQSMAGQAKLVEAGGNVAAQTAGAVTQTFLNQLTPRATPAPTPPLPTVQSSPAAQQ